MKEIKNYLKYWYFRRRGRKYMAMYQNIVKTEFDWDYFQAEKLFPFLTEFKKIANESAWKARAAKFEIVAAGLFD